MAKAPASPSAEDIRQADAQSEEEWAYSVGVQNYVFGLPLTIFERERRVRLDPAALEKAKKFAPAAPINQIGHMKTLATADDVMPYTPNNDTVYSGALLELERRTDHPDRARHPRPLLVGRGRRRLHQQSVLHRHARDRRQGRQPRVRRTELEGHAAPGVIEHRVPTDSVMFAIRIGVLPGTRPTSQKVNALQEQFSLTSLSNWGDPSQTRPGRRARTSARDRITTAIWPSSRRSPICSSRTRHRRATRRLSNLLSRGGITVGKPMDVNRSSEPDAHGVWRAPRPTGRRS